MHTHSCSKQIATILFTPVKWYKWHSNRPKKRHARRHFFISIHDYFAKYFDLNSFVYYSTISAQIGNSLHFRKLSITNISFLNNLLNHATTKSGNLDTYTSTYKKPSMVWMFEVSLTTNANHLDVVSDRKIFFPNNSFEAFVCITLLNVCTFIAI